jgi:hypothetical protein
MLPTSSSCTRRSSLSSNKNRILTVRICVTCNNYDPSSHEVGMLAAMIMNDTFDTVTDASLLASIDLSSIGPGDGSDDEELEDFNPTRQKKMEEKEVGPATLNCFARAAQEVTFPVASDNVVHIPHSTA